MNQSDRRGDAVAAQAPESACDACALGHSRRDFLREGALAALGVFAALGIGSRAASALPVRAARLIRATAGMKTYAIPPQDGADIDKEEQVILVRWQGSVYAFNLSCPHQRTALRWNDGEHQFQCPKHHSRYQPDGTFISGRATRGMDRFPVQRQGDSLVVDVDHMIKQSDDPAAWQAAVVHV